MDCQDFAAWRVKKKRMKRHMFQLKWQHVERHLRRGGGGGEEVRAATSTAHIKTYR